MEDTAEAKVFKFKNYPYLAVVVNTNQLFVVVERTILGSTSSFVDAICALISAYYTFNMSYPNSVKSVLTFLQRIVMDFDDGEQVPPAVSRFCSALDLIEL